MSTLHIVCVYDLATESFGRPFVVTHPGQAVRSFTDEANDGESQICKHAKDYELWTLGELDDSTGSISPHKQRLVRAVDLKRTNQE